MGTDFEDWTLHHVRVQEPVGQGGFHTASLRMESQAFNYVFDCGSMQKFATQRRGRVEAYRQQLRSLAARPIIDMLFISHCHADHINGVEQLLEAGLSIGAIVLPLMNDEERLIAFAGTMVNDAASALSPFYKDFIADPVSALSTFGPDRILFVRNGNGGGAPGSNGEPPISGPDEGRGSELGSQPTEDRLGWKFVGSGRISPHAPDLTSGASGTQAFDIDDTLGVCVTGPSGLLWLLAPYLDQAVKTGQTKFMASLKAELAHAAPDLVIDDHKLAIETIKTLLTEYPHCLAAAYEVVVKDINVTSLCLYSGPIEYSEPLVKELTQSFGCWRRSDLVLDGIAWLTTGDAALAEKKRRKKFLGHYGLLLGNVMTMTLPHHGSEANYHPELLDEIGPDLIVAAAAKYGKWRHPGTNVIQDVASHGRFISVVTEAADSKVNEDFVVCQITH